MRIQSVVYSLALVATLSLGPVLFGSSSTAQTPRAQQTLTRRPAEDKSLTNADIIRMVRSRLVEPSIINAIHNNATHFDLSMNAIIELKKAGVGEQIIAAMIARQAPSVKPEELLEQPYVLVVQGGERQSLPLEPTHVGKADAKGDNLASLAQEQATDKLYNAVELSTATRIGMAVDRRLIAIPLLGAAVGFGGAMMDGVGKAGSLFHKPKPVTYLWAVPGRTSSIGLASSMPQFEVAYGEIPGVDPDEYEPFVVRLVQTRENWRLVGAKKADPDAYKSNKWDTYTDFLEERVPIRSEKLGRGRFLITLERALEGGEYGVVLRPILRSKIFSGEDIANRKNSGVLFDTVWSFSVASEASAASAATPPATQTTKPKASLNKARSNKAIGGAKRKKITPTAQTASTPIYRYPTIECPDEVSAAQEFAVQISLTRELITPGVRIESGKTTEGKLSLLLPSASNQNWKIDVVLSAPDFTFGSKGTNTSSMILSKDEDSSPVVFYLRAKEIEGPKLDANLHATFWHEGAFLARVLRTISIVKAAVGGEQEKEKTPQAFADSPQAWVRANNVLSTLGQTAKLNQVRVAPIEMTFGSEKPDLSLYLFGKEMIIESPYLQPGSHRYDEPKDLPKWLELQYNKFAQLGVRGLSLRKGGKSQSNEAQQQAAWAMRGFGRELYQHFAPFSFKEAFWKLVDKLGPRFKTIQIFSDNPILPWELMCPVRNDATSERGFLGLEFTIGRWHLSPNASPLDRPPQTIPVEQIIVVAPQYEKDRNLPSQDIEIRAIQVFRGFTQLPGQLGAMKRLFEDFPQAIIHFAGHGGIETSNQSVNEYAIQLEDGILNLTTWKGMVNIQNKNHPFFFLNACDVGQAQRTADFVNGWAPAALEAGASGYIGALWPIGDNSAAEFAAQFYRALFAAEKSGDPSVADILRQTRRLFLRNSDPTFLAYIYYGDPNLKLKIRTAR
jgi:CHAT domain-containing protein